MTKVLRKRKDRRSRIRFWAGAILVMAAVISSVWLAALDMKTQNRLVHEVDRGLRADAILFAERLDQLSEEILYDECLRPVLSSGMFPIETVRGDDEGAAERTRQLVGYQFELNLRSSRLNSNAPREYDGELRQVREWVASLSPSSLGTIFRAALEGPFGQTPLFAASEANAAGEIVRIRGARLKPEAIARLVIPEAYVRLRNSLRAAGAEYELLESVFGIRVESPDTTIVLKSLDVGKSSDAVGTYLHTYQLGGLLTGWVTHIDFHNELRSGGWRSLLLSLIPLAIGIFGILFIAGLAMREMEVSQIKSAFVSNASHELKTPITKIQFFNEMLQSLPPEAADKKVRYHDVIARECKRLKLLVENVLDISKVEDGRLRYSFSIVPIRELVHEVVDTAELMYEDDGYSIEVDMEENLPSVRVDPQAIRQVILNLLDNAVKYSSPHAIFVRVARSRLEGRDAVGVTIKDRGIGIPASHIRHIFEEFYRITAGGDQHVSGTGLGLALVRHIVDAHGGSVRVQSREGEGSSFTMLLPIVSEREAKSR